ncbi:MAG: DUF4407 domain-containing protein [Bacteroidota bacterium]
MSRAARFFRNFTLTDEALLQQVNQQRIRRSLTWHGVLVVLIGCLAWGSAVGALYTVFDSLWLAIPFGTIVAGIIVLLDTFIAGATSKAAALLRIPVAVVLGLAIGYAVELTLVSDRLDRVIQEDVDRENAVVLERIREERGLPALEARVERAHEEEARLIATEADYALRANRELVGECAPNQTCVRGEGPAYREAKQNQGAAVAALARLRAERDDLIRRESQLRAEVLTAYDQQKRTAEGDFLAYVEALAHLEEETPVLGVIMWGLRLVLIVLDMAPALVLLFRDNDAYHDALIARASLDRALINQVHNDVIQQATANPASIPSYHTGLVTDRAVPTPSPASPSPASPSPASPSPASPSPAAPTPRMNGRPLRPRTGQRSP